MSNAADHTKSILVIEDDPAVRRLVGAMLKGLPYAVREVPNGQTVLEAVFKAPPDLILLDLLMPGMNGLHVLDRLRDAGARDIPIVVITGTITSEPALVQKGARGVLRKPFSRVDLLRAIETVLRRGTMNRERPGSSFFATRPREAWDQGDLEAEHRPASVLIVEDDPSVQRLLERVLRTGGYTTRSAGNGQEALEHMRAQRPCAVLLDLVLPTMDGWQFRQRQLQEPGLADVPVLCITAVANATDITSELGVPCLRKPLDIPAVLAKVEQLCRSSNH